MSTGASIRPSDIGKRNVRRLNPRMSFGDTGARMPLESADVDGRIVDAAERQREAKREAVGPRMSFGNTGARMPLESADVDGRVVDVAERYRERNANLWNPPLSLHAQQHERVHAS